MKYFFITMIYYLNGAHSEIDGFNFSKNSADINEIWQVLSEDLSVFDLDNDSVINKNKCPFFLDRIWK